MNNPVSASPTGDPWLLTPGPLTTSKTVKQAMLHDYGSRDTDFISINRQIREHLLTLINSREDHVCVPLQGSGTFVVEAMIGNLVGPDDKLLILINGAYGHRMAKICKYYRRSVMIQETAENTPTDCAKLDEILSNDSSISHVAAVYCETSSGILNPIDEIAQVVARRKRHLLIDAMSAFGALPLDADKTPFTAVAASSNKCLEGVPGLGFCLVRKAALVQSRGNSPSLSLDLYDQWQALENNGQWRFTPPTHAMLAFKQALDEYEREGGLAGRGARYRENCDTLVNGMREMGFRTLLADHLQAPIIVTFHTPADKNFVFQVFYDKLRERGYVIYPGKLTVADSFRIGCIGHLGKQQIRGALAAVKATLGEMGVKQCAPADSSASAAA